jgi:bifunctional non-homologous end joining protein LigD
MSKSGRRGRIYVDYLRNGMGATAVGAYSTRAREGAPVSVPLAWDELGPDIRANHFTVLNLPNRLAFLDCDPWEGIGSLKQTLPGTPAVEAPSKDKLAAYWKKVGKKALVHLAKRPLGLARQGPLPALPKAVHKVRLDDKDRFWIDSVEGLLGLVEIGAVELRPWNATIDDTERPDMLVFSLAARNGSNWRKVIDTAGRLRAVLQAEGLESWPKLTGEAELHVMVPIEPELSWLEAHRYSEQIAARLAGVVIDCSYNKRGTAAIGAYSPRTLPGFPIAVPVEWKELGGVRPNAYNLQQPGGRS